MTAAEFAAAQDNDSTHWTTADYETAVNLAEIDAHDLLKTVDCWFCSAPNPATATICGFCCHHTADAPTHAA